MPAALPSHRISPGNRFPEHPAIAPLQAGIPTFHRDRATEDRLAERVVEVPGVHMMEKFGSPEAIWEFRVERFPVVVTMDSHGNSLHAQVLAESEAALKSLL